MVIKVYSYENTIFVISRPLTGLVPSCVTRTQVPLYMDKVRIRGFSRAV
jgi:hypothetical protein